jgi:hypothetical protein
MNTITTTINDTIGTDVVDILLVLEGVEGVLVLECPDCCATVKIYASSLQAVKSLCPFSSPIQAVSCGLRTRHACSRTIVLSSHT